jgi:hypothetical protein
MLLNCSLQIRVHCSKLHLACREHCTWWHTVPHVAVNCRARTGALFEGSVLFASSGAKVSHHPGAYRPCMTTACGDCDDGSSIRRWCSYGLGLGSDHHHGLRTHRMQAPVHQFGLVHGNEWLRVGPHNKPQVGWRHGGVPAVIVGDHWRVKCVGKLTI